MVPMTYLEPLEKGYDPKRTLLVELHGDDLGRMATLTVKRPKNKGRSDPDNYLAPNGASRSGSVPSKWKDNAKFYEYLQHAPGAKLTGAAVQVYKVQRKFTIKEDAEDDGWWKQHGHNNTASTEIPRNLRFKYH
jgi:hypothetical protein